MGEQARQILIITPDGDQVQLLEEAFAEMSERHYAGGFAPECVREYALSPLDAEHLLDRYHFDAILWDFAAGDGLGELPACIRLREQAPATPVILLVGRGDEARALHLIRNGVEDYLPREEVDCLPLARTLRIAIERGRAAQAWHARTLTDAATGFYNQRGFLEAASRNGELACRLQLPFTVTLIECGDAIEEAAGDLRESLPAEVVLGRWTRHELVVAGLDGSTAGAASLAQSRGWAMGSATVWPRGELGEPAADAIDRVVVSDVIASAERALCHNRQVENCA